MIKRIEQKSVMLKGKLPFFNFFQKKMNIIDNDSIFFHFGEFLSFVFVLRKMSIKKSNKILRTLLQKIFRNRMIYVQSEYLI